MSCLDRIYNYCSKLLLRLKKCIQFCNRNRNKNMRDSNINRTSIIEILLIRLNLVFVQQCWSVSEMKWKVIRSSPKCRNSTRRGHPEATCLRVADQDEPMHRICRAPLDLPRRIHPRRRRIRKDGSPAGPRHRFIRHVLCHRFRTPEWWCIRWARCRSGCLSRPACRPSLAVPLRVTSNVQDHGGLRRSLWAVKYRSRLYRHRYLFLCMCEEWQIDNIWYLLDYLDSDV